MTSPWSRKSPWPYDVLLDPGDGLGPVGLMLVPGQDGLLVARTTESLGNVSPTEYGYASQDPAVETTFQFGRLTGGMGESTQTSGPGRRYRYALDVDCSIAGMPRLGPKFAAETFPGLPASTFPGQNDVRQFVVFRHGLTPTTFALVRDHVYRRTAGAWVLSKDFGAANSPMQAVVFQGDAGTAGLWVATSVGELWQYDDATWTQAGTFAAGIFAERVEVVGHELYVASGSDVHVCTSGDPLLAGSWGGAIRVGHPATRISGLRAVGGEIVVFKWDGVYTLTTTADGVEDNELFPELRGRQRVSNGRTAVAWSDHLWFAYGDAYYRMDAGATLEPIGPERLVDLDPAVRGQPVSGAGHADWFFYLGTYNADANTSYLLKYGTWTNTDAESGYEFADAWHGAIAHWVGKRITRVDVVQFDTDLDPSLEGPALWVGFSDGTVAWTPLPSGTPDPAADDACRFVAQGDVYWPLHTADFPATVKSFHGVAGVGPRLSASLTAQQWFRPTPASAYQPVAAAFTATGQRVAFPPTTGVTLDTFTRLATTTDTLTPVLEFVALFEAIRPQAPTLRLGWSFTARAADRVARRDGVASPVKATRIRAALRAAAANPGAVTLRLPDEVVAAMETVGFQEALAPDAGRVGLDHAIAVRLIQTV